MAEPLRHRQTKEAETDMPSLPPPRHIPTLPFLGSRFHLRRLALNSHSGVDFSCGGQERRGEYVKKALVVG